MVFSKTCCEADAGVSLRKFALLDQTREASKSMSLILLRKSQICRVSRSPLDPDDSPDTAHANSITVHSAADLYPHIFQEDRISPDTFGKPMRQG